MNRSISLLLGGVALASCAVLAACRPPIEEMLAAAGNANDDLERHRILVKVSRREDLPSAWRDDLQKLLPVVGAYAGVDRMPASPGEDGSSSEAGYLGFFYRSIRATKDRPAVDYPPAPPRESPLHALYALYRARMLVWYPIQRGVVAADPQLREVWYGEARRLLAEAAAAYPENEIIGMYLGQPIPWPSVASDPEAPEWANLQRAALEKWTDVVEWWIDHRQLSTGELGGGWGDDVEMWRSWPAVLLAFSNPRIEAAQERLSDGIYALPQLRSGFTEKPRDAEHAAEDSSDAIVPMLQLQPFASRWVDRADRVGDLMAAMWIGRNAVGKGQFRSAYIGAAGIGPKPEHAVDTNYHFRTVQPLLLRWQNEPGYRHGPMLADWIDTWVDASLGSANGKPPGIPPATLRWPSGEPGQPGQWWRAGFYGTGLYNFPAALDEMLPALLIAYRRTGKEHYLAPIRALATACDARTAEIEGPASVGSLAWALDRARPALLAVLPRYRAMTGDTRFDDLIRSEGNAWARYVIDGDLAQLLPGLHQLDRALSVNFPAYTQEVRWTDRLMGFSGKYLRYYYPDAPGSPAVNLLYMMTTGDMGHPSYSPMPQVRWHTPSRDIAILVRPSAGTVFAAELFHFGTGRRSFGAEFLMLPPGSYRVALAEWNQETGSYGEDQVMIWSSGTQRGAVLPLDLPSRQRVRLRVEPLSQVANVH